ncbi:YceH family protein [uncultured Paludibaculum sp.]|uniref:YceH family protein n=1 Tax=uncultured Paludibaculum sp. TaxID=1765020 RepID=UPI00374D1742
MSFDLDLVEARVLGCLAEKDMATPEYYPLSLNALTNACNQKTNRDPVVSFDEVTVREALSSLRDRGLATFVSEAGSRVEKFRHRLNERFNFTRGEMSVLTVLLLRGPQTPGELRQRTDRMHAFDDLDALTHTLERLAARDPEPIVRQLERVPGMKEARWAHLLSGEPAMPAAPYAETAVVHGSPLQERVERLEEELRNLREEFDRFKAQFS